MEEEVKGGHNAISYLEGVLDGMRKGREEVVEWIQENSETFETHSGRIIEFCLKRGDWQAKLKEWEAK